MSGGGVHVIFYLNIFLLIGIFLRHFFKKISAVVPYTVLLMLIGVLLGVAAKQILAEQGGFASGSGSGSGSGSSSGSTAVAVSGSGSSAGRRLSASEYWATPKDDFLMSIDVVGFLDPHTMLYIFLPALLFESAQVQPRAAAHDAARHARTYWPRMQSERDALVGTTTRREACPGGSRALCSRPPHASAHPTPPNNSHPPLTHAALCAALRPSTITSSVVSTRRL